MLPLVIEFLFSSFRMSTDLFYPPRLTRFIEYFLDAKPSNTLYLVVSARCWSNPSLIVHPCGNCSNREAARVSRNEVIRLARQDSKRTDPTNKLARPLPDSKGRSVGRNNTAAVPSCVVVFNCPELLELRDGRVSLSTRVTCYCKHHGEKIGYQYVVSPPVIMFPT